jgi:hypothetical protein
MRGKHQQARRRRQQRALAGELDRLRGEVQAETRRAAAARDRAEHARTARERAATDRRLRPQETTAARLATAATSASATIAAALQELHTVERQLSTFTGDDTVRQAIQAGLTPRFVEVHRSAGAPYRATWYRKKAHAELLTTRQVSLAAPRV